MNNDTLTELINTALANYDDDAPASDSPLFRLTIDIMRAATIELAEMLTINNSDALPYYFSDSVYDEYNNPSSIIADCNALINAFYDDPDSLPNALLTMPANIEYLLSYELESISSLANLDDICTALKTPAEPTIDEI